MSIQGDAALIVREEEGKEAVGSSFARKEIQLAPGEAVGIHAYQTHCGAGVRPCWRLFVGAVNAPKGFSILAHNQAYYGMDDNDEYGSYSVITSHVGEDEE